jgi:hypothetical protein
MSAVKVMFIDPAMSIRPSMGSPRSAATVADRAPSAPIRYLARTGYVRPVSRSSTRAVTPSSSCVWERYSVENRVRAPRAAAFLTRIGSRYVCGMSQFQDGEASS